MSVVPPLFMVQPPLLKDPQPEVFRLYSPKTRLYLGSVDGTAIRLVPDAARAGQHPSRAAAAAARALLRIPAIRLDLTVVPGAALPI